MDGFSIWAWIGGGVGLVPRQVGVQAHGSVDGISGWEGLVSRQVSSKANGSVNGWV